MQIFVVQLASAFAALLVGISIDLVGLNLEAGTNQSSGTVLGLNLFITILPMVGLMIAVIYFTKKYKLDDHFLEEITITLKERKKSNDSSVA